jgi:hypothetical protein
VTARLSMLAAVNQLLVSDDLGMPILGQDGLEETDITLESVFALACRAALVRRTAA